MIISGGAVCHHPRMGNRRHSRNPVSGSRRTSCQGKIRHTSKERAFAHLWNLVNTEGAYRPSLHVYRCRHCRTAAWHVGHRPGSQQSL